MSDQAPTPPIAVIDVGSNSGRVVVFRLDSAGHLRMLAGSRAALRLVHDVDETHRLTEQSMGRAMEALRDFRALAQGAGAERILAVATSAVRDADNSEIFIERVKHELGFPMEVIDGKRHGSPPPGSIQGSLRHLASRRAECGESARSIAVG